MQRKSLIVSMLFALLTFSYAPLVHAGYDYETSYDCAHNVEHRVAGEADDWIERGRAAVTGSPVFADGIRLSAWAGEEEEDYEPGLASAIYRFVVPPGTHYLKILVRYRDASEEDVVAGRLWIKTADDHVEREMESEEEAPLYGDTFVLRSDRTSETICVPAARHEDNGKVELHVVADGKDCLDVKYVRVEYRRRRPVALRIIARPYYDYWHVWPWHRYVYHYYYWGPYYWPRGGFVYVHWAFPCHYYWYVFRPAFRTHVRLHYSRYQYWCRQYSVMYDRHPDDPPEKRRNQLRQHLKKRYPTLAKGRKQVRPNHGRTGKNPGDVRHAPHPQGGMVGLSNSATGSRTKETYKRRQLLNSPKTVQPGSVVRQAHGESAQMHEVQDGESKPKKAHQRQPEPTGRMRQEPLRSVSKIEAVKVQQSPMEVCGQGIRATIIKPLKVVT